MTPPGRWLRHINNSTNFTANDTTGGRNEYSVRYQVLPPHLLPTLVSRCRSELTEFTKWNHLPQVGSPLPQQSLLNVFLGWKFAFSPKSSLMSSFLKTQRHISKRGSNHPLFRQCIFILPGYVKWLFLICHHALHSGLQGRCILKDRTWHQRLILNFLFKEHICIYIAEDRVYWGAVF